MKEIWLTNTEALRREMEKVLVIDEKVNEMKKELVFEEDLLFSMTEDLYRLTLSALLDLPEGADTLEIFQFILNEEFRKEVMAYTKDPIVKNYWENIFPTFPSSFLLGQPIEKHYDYYVKKTQSS